MAVLLQPRAEEKCIKTTSVSNTVSLPPGQRPRCIHVPVGRRRTIFERCESKKHQQQQLPKAKEEFVNRCGEEEHGDGGDGEHLPPVLVLRHSTDIQNSDLPWVI